MPRRAWAGGVVMSGASTLRRNRVSRWRACRIHHCPRNYLNNLLPLIEEIVKGGLGRAHDERQGRVPRGSDDALTM